MKFCLCQISNNLINPPNSSTAEKFYDTFWQAKRKDGYYKPGHFWELPLWIAEICYTLPNDVERELHIVTDYKHELPGDADYYLFSVLDVNKDIVAEIIRRHPDKVFILGGYVKSMPLMSSVKEFCDYFKFDYKYGTDYSLFAGTECVPRLTLSTGCRHRCKFCTIENEVIEKTCSATHCQIESFKLLKFKLIYVSDKTFGQARNYVWLDAIYKEIKSYNPEFEGFIVQTTAAKVGELSKTVWEDCHIKFVEIGVETFNDKLLQRYRKPAREHDITQATLTLNHLGVKVIANLILGLPGETSQTYAQTYDFLSSWWSSKFYSLNIYTFAAYADAEATKELDVNAGDADELNDDRTFWTVHERVAFKHWSEAFYKLGIDIILEN